MSRKKRLCKYSKLAYLLGICWRVDTPLLAAEQMEWFESARHQGRGGTRAAATDSDESAFFNPATLSETKIRFQWRPAQLDTFVGQNSINTIQKIAKATQDSSDGFINILKSMEFGERLYGRIQAVPAAFRFKAFEISAFATGTGAFDIHDPVIPKAAWLIDSVQGMQASYAFNWTSNWSLGLTLRPFSRSYSSGELSVVDILEYVPPATKEMSDTFAIRTGTGVAADYGLIWRPAKNWRFGLSHQNVGNASVLSSNSDSPPPIKQSLRLGTWYRSIFKAWNLDSSFDFSDILAMQKFGFWRSTRLGLELGRPIWTRDHDIGVNIGLREGYFSYGLFADLYLFRIDFSYYSVEEGLVAGQRKDSRYAISLKSSMTF